MAKLKDKIKLVKIENKELSYDEILDSLTEILNIIRPTLEKVNKSIYPKYDSAMHNNIPLQNNLKIDTLMGNYIEDKKE